MYGKLGSILRSRVLTGVLSVILLAVSAGWALRLSGQKALDQELARLRAQGTRVAVSDFRPRSVGADSNAAPLYGAAIELSQADPLLQDASDNLDKTLQEKADAVRRLLESRAVVFTLLACAYERPECAYDYHIQDGFRMRTPAYLRVRTLARTAALRAGLEARDGNAQGAVRTTAWALRFLDRFRYPNSLIHQMIKVACYKTLLTPLEAMAERGVRVDYGPALVELRTVRQQQETAMRETVEVERALAVDLFDRVARGEESLAEVVKCASGLVGTSATWKAYAAVGAPVALQDELTLLAYYRGVDEAIAAHDVARLPRLDPPAWALVTQIMVPNYTKALEVDGQLNERMAKLVPRLEALQSR